MRQNLPTALTFIGDYIPVWATSRLQEGYIWILQSTDSDRYIFHTNENPECSRLSRVSKTFDNNPPLHYNVEVEERLSRVAPLVFPPSTLKRTLPNMALFLKRLNRIKTNFEVLVHLQENNPQNVLNDNLVATAVNVSKGGACLMLPKIFLNGVHIFFSTLREDNHTLVLRCMNTVQESDGENTILAQSVWMDSCEEEDGGGFKMGVRFVERQKELYESLKSGRYRQPVQGMQQE